MLRNVILKALHLDELGLSSEQNDVKKLIEFVAKVYDQPYQEIQDDPDDKTELTPKQLTALKAILIEANPGSKSLPKIIILQLFEAISSEFIKKDIPAAAVEKDISVAVVKEDIPKELLPEKINMIIAKLESIVCDKTYKEEFDWLVLKYKFVIRQPQKTTGNKIEDILRKELLAWLNNSELPELLTDLIFT